MTTTVTLQLFNSDTKDTYHTRVLTRAQLAPARVITDLISDLGGAADATTPYCIDIKGYTVAAVDAIFDCLAAPPDANPIYAHLEHFDIPTIWCAIEFAHFLDCNELALHIGKVYMVDRLLTDKSVKEITAAFSLPEDTVFTPDEIARLNSRFPFLMEADQADTDTL